LSIVVVDGQPKQLKQPERIFPNPRPVQHIGEVT